MKLPKLRKWDKLEITWTDAQSADGGYGADEYVRRYTRCVRRTLGYYLGCKDSTIFIAETDDRNSGNWYNEPQDCERINAIPYGMIDSVAILYDKD